MRTALPAPVNAPSTIATTAAPLRTVILHRCACGGASTTDVECENCKNERLQRSAAGQITAGVAPPIVRDVLRSSGQPLGAETRTYMESRFGHDFSRVRVHTDATAAESAKAVNAFAWTVDNHVAFASGRYAPHTRAGRTLLAHELAHVAQQTGSMQRSSISPTPQVEIGPSDSDLEREARDAAEKVADDEDVSVLSRATDATLRRVPAIEGFDDAGPTADLTGGGDRERRLFECLRTAKPDPVECDPARSLTWADFTGAAPAGNPFAAETSTTVTDHEVPSQQCVNLIYGRTTAPLRQFHATFIPASSWVKRSVRLAANPAVNGCAARIADCRAHHARETAARHVGATFAMRTVPNAACPAGVPARGDVATTAAECNTILAQDCQDQALAESARVLNHEQGHMNLSCEFARRATSALYAGATLVAVRKAVNDKLDPTQKKYDNESQHGCDAGQQATWESEIANHLPSVAIP